MGISTISFPLEVGTYIRCASYITLKGLNTRVLPGDGLEVRCRGGDHYVLFTTDGKFVTFTKFRISYQFDAQSNHQPIKYCLLDIKKELG